MNEFLLQVKGVAWDEGRTGMAEISLWTKDSVAPNCSSSLDMTLC